MTKQYKQITLEERTLIQTQLQQGSKPRHETILKIVRALGVKLSATPLSA